jgi:hypothetical protein
MMDNVILSWLFGTITANLRTPFARAAAPFSRSGLSLRNNSLAIVRPVPSTSMPRLRSSSRGISASVNDYYRKMKGMADDLHDLSEQVEDRTFVLNVLQGLNK